MEKFLDQISPLHYQNDIDFFFIETDKKKLKEDYFLPTNNLKLNLIRYFVYTLKKIVICKYYENFNIKNINNDRSITMKNCIEYKNKFFLINVITSKNNLIEKINYGNINLKKKIKQIFILLNIKNELSNEMKDLIEINNQYNINCYYDKLTK